MVPAQTQVQIIDNEKLYCPESLRSSPADLDNGRMQPPSQDLAARSARQNEHLDLDAGTCNHRIHASIHGRKRARDEFFEECMAGRMLVDVQSDSGPSAWSPSSLHPSRTHAQCTGNQNWIGVPDGERKEPRGIKQGRLSPALLGHYEEQGKLPVTAPKCSIQDGVTTRTLLLRLDRVFPQMGFREFADSTQHVWVENDTRYRSECHQALVDLLGEEGMLLDISCIDKFDAPPGALNEYTLTTLHDARFFRLDLGPTMRGINQLNLPLVFGRPGYFQHLKTLSFAGGRFQTDFALTQIQSLRQIEKLVLADTGIGNGGVFHIVALKHNLRHLDLSGNPLINDNAMPALISFENLQWLLLFGTGILMPGLRKLAVSKRGDHMLNVGTPGECEDYINSMHTKYLLHLEPPLVSEPDMVSILTNTALSRNLQAHAAIDSSIVASGSRDEMEQRLRALLETRKLDLVVRERLVGGDQEGFA